MACIQAGTPLARHLHWYWPSHPIMTRICSWPGWPSISDSQHPALLLSICRWRDCCMHVPKRLTCTDTLELLTYGQFEGEELHLDRWVVKLSFGQASAGRGDQSIHPIISSLVEDSPRPEPQTSVCSLKGLSKSVYANTNTTVHQNFNSSKDHWQLLS